MSFVERMQKAASTGHMNAFAAATYLTCKGVPFRIAHEQIGKAVRLALDAQYELQDLTLEQLRNIDSHFSDDFYDFVKLENVLAIHDVAGGTAPETGSKKRERACGGSTEPVNAGSGHTWESHRRNP